MKQIFYGKEHTSFKVSSQHASHAQALAREIQAQEMGFIQDVYTPCDTFSSMKKWAQSWARSLRHIIVLGTGGSSLGGQALYHILGQNKLGPQLIFLDNLDPLILQNTLKHVAISKTGVLVISKSGHTIETMAHFLACWKVWCGETVLMRPEHFFVVVTDPKPSPLRSFAETHKLPLWNHPEHTGGRFSVWSSVGWLPAFMKNIDFESFQEGARSVFDDFMAHPAEHAATLGALWHMTHQKPQHVMLPYRNHLTAFGAWHRQLWAESLGKDGQGTTPQCALGPVDQHSQLQLYLDGPADKAYTFIVDTLSPELHSEDLGAVPLSYDPTQDTKGWEDLQGVTIDQLLEAEQQATRASLEERGRPVREWVIRSRDPYDLGALMAHAVLEVLLLAKFWGLNPYDQPAVERVKQKTREILKSYAQRNA